MNFNPLYFVEAMILPVTKVDAWLSYKRPPQCQHSGPAYDSNPIVRRSGTIALTLTFQWAAGYVVHPHTTHTIKQ